MFTLCLASVLLAVAAATPVPSLDGRIVGGQAGEIEQFPYQISMQYYGQHMCGGSIINSKYIVTAAHCTNGQSAKDLTIRAGSTYYASGGQRVQVGKIIQHPLYDAGNQDYDISILELAYELRLTNSVSPIKLPYQNEPVPSGAQAVCSGWGALSEGGGAPPNLMYVFLPTISRSSCDSYYSAAGLKITPRMTCTFQPRTDACQGDSGGPLALDGKLVGVVSWGIGCARPNYPGVYADVGSLRSFIDASIRA